MHNLKPLVGIIHEFSLHLFRRSLLDKTFGWVARCLTQPTITTGNDHTVLAKYKKILNENSNITGLLEIKAFYSSANFDVANFEAYCDSITKQAYRLDADYLIFSYDIQDYKFKVKKVWLKKIWEITGKSDRYPVRCQAKRNVIYNIRPISWYSEKTKYKPFTSRYDFVTALYDTLMQYHRTSKDSNNWLERVKSNYWDYTQKPL